MPETAEQDHLQMKSESLADWELQIAAIGQLQNEKGLSLVKLWLAGLVGGLRLEQNGGFYDAAGVAITSR